MQMPGEDQTKKQARIQKAEARGHKIDTQVRSSLTNRCAVTITPIGASHCQ